MPLRLAHLFRGVVAPDAEPSPPADPPVPSPPHPTEIPLWPDAEVAAGPRRGSTTALMIGRTVRDAFGHVYLVELLPPPVALARQLSLGLPGLEPGEERGRALLRFHSTRAAVWGSPAPVEVRVAPDARLGAFADPVLLDLLAAAAEPDLLA